VESSYGGVVGSLHDDPVIRTATDVVNYMKSFEAEVLSALRQSKVEEIRITLERYSLELNVKLGSCA
jgi:hypothetical protein